MIPLNFYRDDNYVYYNNPNGITKKMSIADFESLMSNESELPEYSSASQGKVLSVDSDGDLEWTNLPPAELPAYTSSDGGKVLTVNSGGTGVEWGEGGGGGLTPLIVNCIITQDHGIDVYTLDKTWKEINDAYLTTIVIVKLETSNYCVIECGYSTIGDPFYDVSFGTGSNAFTLSTTSENGYPLYMST